VSVVEDYKGANGKWVGAKRIAEGIVQTRSYVRWGNMRLRCKVGGAEQQRRPTYVGCTMSSLFSDFQTFTDWHVTQVGYGLPCYDMDKDILVHGNKEYNEKVCVLVPKALNAFLTSHDAARGDYPQGVNFHKRVQKFAAMVSSDSHRIHLGYFTTPEAASVAYKEAKEVESHKWYERLKAGEFAVDPRVIERMRTWTFENN